MHTGNTSLFAVFALSIYSLFLFPYSCYSLCCRSDEEVVQPFLQVRPGLRRGLLTHSRCTLGGQTHTTRRVITLMQGKKKESGTARLLKKVFTKRASDHYGGRTGLCAGWS